jgi:hypothetical protein
MPRSRYRYTVPQLRAKFQELGADTVLVRARRHGCRCGRLARG